MMEMANDKNAKVITLTDTIHSPMCLYSACNLLADIDSRLKGLRIDVFDRILDLLNIGTQHRSQKFRLRTCPIFGTDRFAAGYI